MVSKVFLIVNLQLLVVLCVATHRTQNDLVEAFRNTRSVEENRKETTATQGQSLDIKTILNHLFPNGIAVSDSAFSK